jgi:hypothetical protein
MRNCEPHGRVYGVLAFCMIPPVALLVTAIWQPINPISPYVTGLEARFFHED